MAHLIAPSLLSANFLNLEEEIGMVNRSEADWLHLDIMDGLFVPNISFGFPVLEHIKKISQKPMDVHLMIVDPDRYLERFRKVGADIITVHYETCPHLHRTVQTIKNTGAKAGVVLNPHTPVSLLNDILPDLDLVLLMSVNPGFGGQKFIPHVYQKALLLKTRIREEGLNVLIEVDGGVDLNNARPLVDAGVDVLVAGNTVFASENPLETISRLKHA
jgi:ribulose-phosphate 3-epimerase